MGIFYSLLQKPEQLVKYGEKISNRYEKNLLHWTAKLKYRDRLTDLHYATENDWTFLDEQIGFTLHAILRTFTLQSIQHSGMFFSSVLFPSNLYGTLQYLEN